MLKSLDKLYRCRREQRSNMACFVVLKSRTSYYHIRKSTPTKLFSYKLLLSQYTSATSPPLN